MRDLLEALQRRLAALLCVGVAACSFAQSVSTSESRTSPTSEARSDAAKAAEKLVAPAGARVQSTEDAQLGPGEVVVPTPAVQLQGNKLMVSDAQTSQVVDVKSGAELLKKLNIIAPAQVVSKGAREVDETTPTELFRQEEIRRLLGESPTVVYQVVYDGKPLPDPMIIPWVRNAVVLKERFDEAVALLAQNRIQQGREALLAIITEFPNTEYARQAQEILQKLQEETAQPKEQGAIVRATPTPPPVQIMVDPNIRVGSILVDAKNPEENRVMINGRSYRAGDVIRGFSNHRVVKVTDGAVVIEVEAMGQRKEFTIPIKQRSE
jgi:TolA-binding protein